MRRITVKDNVQVDLFGCHRWTGKLDADGYGKVGQDLAHRRAWEDANGPIGAGLWIDHLCSVRDCVNLAHLEPVSPRENILRSERTIAGINARKTHCKHGHPFDDSNTRWGRDGSRQCRACGRIRYRHSKGATYRGRTGGRRRRASRPPNKARK